MESSNGGISRTKERCSTLTGNHSSLSSAQMTTCVWSALFLSFWLRVLPTGARPFIAKLATFVFRVRLHEFERERIGDVLRHDPTKDNDALLVAFAGGALQLGGQSRPEFVQCTDHLCVDRLFLTDPSNAWYSDDVYKNELPAIFGQYRRVILIGNCLGATGALRFARLASVVIAINPHVDPHSHTNWFVRFGARRLASKSFVDELNESIRECPSVQVYGDKSRANVQQVNALDRSAPGLRVFERDVSAHLAKAMRDSKELANVLERAIAIHT
jgi:hypothetical protein